MTTSPPRQKPAEIQAYYRDPTVVAEYIERRTAQPLNGMLHRRQVQFIDQVIGERRPQRVLEVAPGPARLTAELAYAGRGIAVDGSAEMLAVARDRLRARPGHWLVVRGDAFALPVPDASVDLAFAIRFVRRFAPEVRRRLYAEIRRTLTPNGALIVDAQNRAVSLPHRQRKGLDSYPVFDALYDRDELVGEIEGAGFRVRRLEGMVRHFAVQSRLNRLRHRGLAPVASGMIGLIECLPSRAPSTWMVLAEVTG
ncbi:class I SAM-dependent methyltransferase [bacterium]|nr:class I SAM-dependent methyltransferase [bacterium]